jgi:hypothetical protein
MTWVKLDDGFFDNGTNRRLGADGRDLFVAGLCFCAKGLTDGRIPKADLGLVLASAQAKQRTVKRLVDAGRWVDGGDHFEVVDYLRYQPSREKVLADRAAAASRQKSRRDSLRDQRRESRQTIGVSHAHPVPSRPFTDKSSVVDNGTRPPSDDDLLLDIARARAQRLGKPNAGRRWLDTVTASLNGATVHALAGQGLTAAQIDVELDKATRPHPDDETARAQRALADRNSRRANGTYRCERCQDLGVTERDDGTFDHCDHATTGASR